MKLTEIHKDKRGEILSVTGLKKFEEITIFTTKATYARGGCIHKKNSEHLCVVEGKINYVYEVYQHSKILKAGQSITISPNTPHYFIALEDSVVLEWGATAKEKKEKYLKFREIVEKINEKNKS
ncbi:hypothetical protein LCGC14_2424340 [marine sediment metagenome]|uniref:Cupin type-2 domain-containing protein n=1 Tax=marine sediment metagenome TaxID=412755 RepID=A0A0F9CAX5_9ZZZZ